MRLRVVGSAVIAGVAVASALPPVQARLKAPGVLGDALGRNWPRPFAQDVDRTEVTINSVAGDLYVPSDGGPPIVLVHGGATRGKEDPRLIRLARSLAAAGRLVFVPDLLLKNRTFEASDIERIVASISGMADHPQAEGPPQVIGISHGGSFALIAAADERVRNDIVQIAVFGAYFDLVGYVQAITTGTSIVDGRSIEWDARTEAEDVLREVSLQLVPDEARPLLRAALQNDVPADQLPPEVSSVYALLTNENPRRTAELAREAPTRVTDILRTFSPSRVADRIKAPVLVMHSRADPAVPYAEALRLTNALPSSRLITVDRFRHVDLEEGVWSAVRDVVGAWRFASLILSAQEDLF